MGYQAQVVNVMIASPSDVPAERRLVREAIYEWNAVHAADRKTVLMPIGWETSLAPEMGDRPQAIINRRLLRDADLLVAVFWTRLGSPTGEASSGTVEEINEHLSNGKPAMIYFSSAPVRPDSVDAEQYEKLMAFKADVRSRGLLAEYDDLASFHDLFSRHLAQTVIARFLQDADAGSSDRLPSPRQELRLSDAAGDVLAAAARDGEGVVMCLETMDGTHVQTRTRAFVDGSDARAAAKWKGAVKELAQLGLLEDRAGEGEVFFVTDLGYREADLLAGR